jgi:F-type H+-transporting ATPase subunit epsilon
MSSSTIELQVVTPARQVFSQPVDEVVLPGAEGYLGVLPGHAPLLTALDAGVLRWRAGARKGAVAISAGFAEVLRERVSVLAETAERSEEIDVDRARESKRRAEGELKDRAADDRSLRLAEARLKRALARLEAASRTE